MTSHGHPQALRPPRQPGGRVFSRLTLGLMARTGLVARGVVYGIIGVLALKLALGSGGKAASQQGALEAVAHEPLGEGLLIAIGLGAYALWRMFEGLIGSGPREKEAMHRISAVASGLAYAVLCESAIQILAGSPLRGIGELAPGGRRNSRLAGWTGDVAVAGLIIIGVGNYATKMLARLATVVPSAAPRG